MSISYGPFTNIVESTGFVAAAAAAIVTTLWGKGFDMVIADAGRRRLFKVSIIVSISAAIIAIIIYANYFSINVIFALFSVWLLLGLACITVLMTMPVDSATASGGRPIYLQIGGIVFTSSALALGTNITDRSIHELTPTSGPIVAQGQNDGGGEFPVILRGIERQTAVLTLSGKASWYTSVRGSSGTVTIRWGARIDGLEHSTAFKWVLPVPPDVGATVGHEGIRESFIVKIPDTSRTPGSPIHGFVKIERCRLNEPDEKTPPPGNYANCKFDGVLSALPN